MNQTMLCTFAPGQTGTISELFLSSKKLLRLQELGLTAGAPIQCDYIAPGGTPMAFRVKGALIALRKCDCDQIVVNTDV